jgi:hypothetical protein
VAANRTNHGQTAVLIAITWLGLNAQAYEFAGGTEITTAQECAGETWDFDTVWMICEGQDCPHLQWENIECGS